MNSASPRAVVSVCGTMPNRRAGQLGRWLWSI